MAAAVAVADGALASGQLRGGGVQHRVHELGVGRGRLRPGDAHPVETVDDGARVDLAGGNGELGDVGEPERVRTVGVEIAFHQVLGRLADLAFAGTVLALAGSLGDEPLLLHDPPPVPLPYSSDLGHADHPFFLPRSDTYPPIKVADCGGRHVPVDVFKLNASICSKNTASPRRRRRRGPASRGRWNVRGQGLGGGTIRWSRLRAAPQGPRGADGALRVARGRPGLGHGLPGCRSLCPHQLYAVFTHSEFAHILSKW